MEFLCPLCFLAINVTQINDERRFTATFAREEKVRKFYGIGFDKNVVKYLVL